MQERLNTLKAATAAGRAHIGIWCSLASALTTEIVAGSGADWVLIDGEHSPNHLRSIMAQLQVMGGFDSEAVVRLPSDDPNLIKQALDIGARSLMIPNVRTADQARAIVAAMSYAPGGFRGFSVGHRANGFGRIAGYHAKAREQQLLAVQIEDELGVANAAEIAGVDGVDVLFVGPGDLSTNMGAMGNPGAAHVQEAISSVRQAATAAGKASGILAPAKADADRYLAEGFTMVAVGSDLGLLARGSDALIALFNQ
ncbi:2-dehydro-3-deoxyglucarate aldolase [Mesorhizobium sp. M7A.F.Ca.CA.001.07.2.1]|uniref:HpcH/HpaI aldolase family protein n=2 Tax=Phyllobacteriaceae TaxID=69277 RepID=UPI000FCB52EA|nr:MULTISPECIES: HpcH/HpaI aldolase/citrate lyase family protein [Mesorhizobium]MCF6123995.1 HpcH/HpaI aldolase/citrate lyase family protein [Mesorhizobium ciceri]MCQ8814994.1 HpcH/HpaI aldolase/citrate lyase family protein [Mesorhizobium sp. SEMIA396]RUX76057.1 2-dehydro-3-deoxyglucarate aldolase [Mesorhizobium sp. M7A.F.Ca.CA.004.08.2.1]RUX85585.1 2-dehydro-3-deoxyglucarate aldolase [Mesorhizobium sp. M7A.F.Ca.CA.004.08.1.1]RUY57432.1 2-dehydro-3-deoxyglucarate aldolase [Mesorhizobium sp. M7